MIQSLNLALGYENITLSQPKLSVVPTRSDCDTSVQLGSYTFDIPVLPSNMKCCITPFLGAQLAVSKYFHILHRFDTPALSDLREYQYLTSAFIKSGVDSQRVPRPDAPYTSISIGVQRTDKQLIDQLAREMHTNFQRIDFITIDVAHGHHILVLDMIKYIKHKLPNTFVIAGNIATPRAVTDLENAGADAVKVGIGPGKACTTFLKTGFMSPMFTTVQRCAEVAKKPIIADGGIRTNGDIVKAIVAGASMVMVGSMFAELSDSPAKTINTGLWPFKREKLKEFYGSASEHNKGHNKHIEGTRILLKQNPMKYLAKMADIKESLQSAISYAGGTDIKALNTLPYDIIP